MPDLDLRTAGQRIFISYGRSDAGEVARQLAASLRETGYRPWLDVEEGIPPGSPFDSRIEAGIEASSALVALLSPGSVRRDSFCRRELLFARAHRKPILPVRLAEVTPPIQIIDLSFLEVGNDRRRLSEIPGALAELRRAGDREPAEPAAWWDRLRPLRFDEELARHGGSFVGREPLFELVNAWLEEPDSPVFWLTADAGAGKSAIAAQLTARLEVAAVHFCTRAKIESCRPASWIAGVAHQLAARHPAFRRHLEKLDPPDWSLPAESLFASLISAPLAAEGEGLRESPAAFVVDGLDEAVASAGFALVDLIADVAPTLPRPLKILLTGRPDERLLARLRIPGVRHHPMDVSDEAYRGDVEAYLRGHGVEARCENTEIQPLTDYAAGNFLVAKMALDAAGEDDPASRLELGAGRLEPGGRDRGSGAGSLLPTRLGGLYHAMFRRRFADLASYEHEILPLLDCLVAARSPVDRRLLIAATSLDERTARRGLRQLSQFLTQLADGVTLFHGSLADFLARPEMAGDYQALPAEGHRRLAAACGSEYAAGAATMSTYAARHLPAHLAATESWDAAETLLCDLEYLALVGQLGGVAEIQNDYEQVLGALPERRAETRRRETRRAEIADYTARLAAGPSRPPRPPTAVRLRSSEEIAEAVQRATAEPSRWDRIRAFAQWVRAESHHLSAFGDRPGFCLQLAYNSSRDGPVHAAARALVRQGAEATLLLDANRPAFNPSPALLRTLEGHRDSVNAVVVAADGETAVSAGDDGTLRVWNLRTGSLLRTLEGPTAALLCLAVTPDLRRAVAGGNDRHLWVFDLASGEALHRLPNPGGRIAGVSLSADGSRAATAHADGDVVLWDPAGGHQIARWKGHDGGITCVALSADGTIAVTAGDDGTIRLWDAAAQSCSGQLEGHSRPLTAIALTPDASRLVSADSGELRVWDLASRRCTFSREQGERIEGLAITPDGRVAIAGIWDHRLALWDLERGRLVRHLTGHTYVVSDVAMTPDGRLAVSASWDCTLRAWDLEHGHSIDERPFHNRAISSLEVVPGRRLAVSAADWSGDVCIWETAQGRKVEIFEGHSDLVFDLAVTPDGRRLVTASMDRTLRVWNLTTGVCEHVLEGHEHRVFTVVTSPCGRLALSASADRTARLWDLETGECVRSLKTQGDHAALAADGRLALTRRDGTTAGLWDVATGKLLRPPEPRSSRSAAAVSPDGRWTVAHRSGDRLEARRLATGEVLWHVDDAEEASPVITRDGRRVLWSSPERRLRVFDLATGVQQLEIGPTDWNSRFAVTPDGGAVLSACYFGTLRIWDLVDGRPVALAATHHRLDRWLALDGASTLLTTTTGGVHPIRVEPRLPADRQAPAVTTAVRIFCFAEGRAGRWADTVSALCPHCGSRSAVPRDALRALEQIRDGSPIDAPPSVTLPDDAFDDPRLKILCCHCRGSLRLNPYLIDSSPEI